MLHLILVTSVIKNSFAVKTQAICGYAAKLFANFLPFPASDRHSAINEWGWVWYEQLYRSAEQDNTLGDLYN